MRPLIEFDKSSDGDNASHLCPAGLRNAAPGEMFRFAFPNQYDSNNADCILKRKRDAQHSWTVWTSLLAHKIEDKVCFCGFYLVFCFTAV